MAIRTFSTQESYREGAEPRKRLKKVRSVKVATLDRLKLSMTREKSWFNRGVVVSTDDATDPSASGSSSAAISGTSSPNYMKATTCSSARKGTVQGGSGSLQFSPASSSDSRISSAKPASKLSKVSGQECSDPTDVNIRVRRKAEKSLKRVPSLKHSKKLSSKKSMKIRARYSQFQDVGISPNEMLDFGILGFQDNTEIICQSQNCSDSHDQDSIGKVGAKQKGILKRTSSRKMMRLRSIRTARTKPRPQSRLNGGATELTSSAEPHYMRGTSSQETRKNFDKGLKRTSSLRPLRILAKIPSLRPKRSKAKKRPQTTPLPRKGVERSTCSSILKRTEFPDDIELPSRGQESEGTSSLYICPYSYCSIHGHRHHAPSQPLKEFISSKRKLLSNQNGKEGQSRRESEHYTSATESDHSRQIASAESYAVRELMNVTTENVPEDEEDGIEYLVKIYAKPRKKWTSEGKLSKDSEELSGYTYDQISVLDYDRKQTESLSETSEPEEMQGALNVDQQEKYEISIDLNNKTQEQICNIASLSLPSEIPDSGPNSVFISKTLEQSIAEKNLQNSYRDPFQFASKDSAVSQGGDLINILSDKQKYSSMWQLIHQQLLSSEASMNESQEVIQADEKESGDGNTYRELSNLDLVQSKYNNNLNEDADNLNEDVDDQVAMTQKLELDQTAAIKLVQEALNAMLQHNAVSNHQQSNSVKKMAINSVREHISTPAASTEENFKEGGEIDREDMILRSTEKQYKMKQVGNKLLQKEPHEQEMSGRKMSKSLSKLKKLFVTAKFIKVMERLKKINPRKPQILSAEPASENERVYLRHLSMNVRKNTEEWMLDNALRQVISRLDSDQQRRVAQLVEAFEAFTPEQERSNKRYAVTSVPALESKQFMEPEQEALLSHEQVVQKTDNGHLVTQEGVPEENTVREEHEYQANATGENILLESDETNTSDSNLMLSEKSSKSDGVISIEEPLNTPTVPSQFPTGHSEVSLAGDASSIFFNKQQYTGMWNLIYQHVSSEALVDENQGVNGLDEENHGDPMYCKQVNDRDSLPSNYIMDLKEDDNQSAASEKPELDQSDVIKLVKEALSAILKHYEQPPHLQSIQDHQKAADNARNLYISTPTPSTGKSSLGGEKSAKRHDSQDLEDKLHHVEKTSSSLQEQVESGELQTTQRKMPNSLGKLKKAIATTRFIKAMERLTKSSSRKSQNLCSDTTTEKERVYLRHQSIDGRKTREEWMLDHALRQVISKLDPDEQRRVRLLVKAFETVHPEHNEKSIKCYPFKGEGTNEIVLATSTNEVKEFCLKSQPKRSISIEQILRKQDNGTLFSSTDAFHERSLQENHDQLMSLADDKILQETFETAISKSTLDLSEDSSKLACMVVTPKESCVQDEEIEIAIGFPSPFPTGNSEIRSHGDIATILSDKQKYTSMWNLIHQQVLSNEAITARKQKVNEVDEEKQGNNANTCPATNDPDLTQSVQSKKSKVDDDNQSAALDQLAAINLVKEAINAILQSHEQKPDQQSHQEHSRDADNARELCDTTALLSTKENSEGERVEKRRNSELEEKLHEVENTSAPFQMQAEPNEAYKDHQRESKSLAKLKKAIVTTKFIKAMERLRKINPRKPRHLPPEVASEEERVYLRHSNINERRIDEGWMLDYALRKVLSNLAPDQQKKVALLVEAFETVNPKKKGLRCQMKSARVPAFESESTTYKKQIPEPEHERSTSYNEDIPLKHNDRLDMLDEGPTFKKCEKEDQAGHTILDSEETNWHIHHQAGSKGSPVSNSLSILTERSEEIDADPIHDAFQHADDPENDTEVNKTKGVFCNKKKYSGMWHLIYQHIKSISAAEGGSKLSAERLDDEDQVNRGVTSSEMIADADGDDSDASSVTSELTESDAIKLVREAITDILDAPQDLGDDLSSSNRTAISEESQRTVVEEKPNKSLSKGYSKLRQFIICNKFIKAIEKTQKFDPQKLTGQALKSDSKARKAHLNTCAVGERKGMDEWMLDNVLQKVIAGLAPVQQRRVSLLVKAFEKVKPDTEERGKGIGCTVTEFPNTIPSEGDTKGKEDSVSSQNSKFLVGIDLKLDSSQEFRKDRSIGLTKEYVSNGESWRSADPLNIKDTTEIDGTDAPGVSPEERSNFTGSQIEERTLIGEQEVENNELAYNFAKKATQTKGLEDEWSYSTQNSRSLEKSTSLWGLILQHVSMDMLEKNEDSKKIQIEENAQDDSNSSKVSERKTNKYPRKAAKSCRDIGVQTPTSFEFEDNEAIKMVEEAVEEMLLIEDQISDTESMTSSTTSEKELNSQDIEDVRDASPSATEIPGIATALHTVATPEKEKKSSHKNSPNSHSTVSKVVLCKRFIKAMNKMQKLKALHAQDISEPPRSQEGNPSLRQTSTSNKANWEEGMLDHALQKVIGNLAPEKKQRVALLVHAFEKVGTQPEPTNSWRRKTSVS